MNMQGTLKTGFVDTAGLAGVVVALSRASCLSLPVVPVERLESTAPTWVLFSGHSGFMRDVEAFLAAILRLALHLVGLSLKAFAAYGAFELHSRSFCNQALRALPSPTAFAATKVVRLSCTWRCVALLAAPLTREGDFASSALRAKVDLRPRSVPVWAHKNHAALCAIHWFEGFALRFSRTSARAEFASVHRCLKGCSALLARLLHDAILTCKCQVGGDGRESVGAMSLDIARARVAYWQSKQPML
jgi:hypothetical protein